jgi:hypothetical protein
LLTCIIFYEENKLSSSFSNLLCRSVVEERNKEEQHETFVLDFWHEEDKISVLLSYYAVNKGKKLPPCGEYW